MTQHIDREWIEIQQPEAEITWLFDKDFLTSNWNCIFNRGCKGVFEHDASELNHGCCSHGAHFRDKQDLKQVVKATKKLTDDIWQFKSIGDAKGIFKTNKKQESITRLVDDACIFLNRNDFHKGPGCALHLLSIIENKHHSAYKPEVCWQLPLRKEEFEFQAGGRMIIIKAWERSDWGEGGNDFHWWCTQDDLAYSGSKPVYLELATELELLCGTEIYSKLKIALDEFMPIIKSRQGRLPKYDSKNSITKSKINLSRKKPV